MKTIQWKPTSAELCSDEDKTYRQLPSAAGDAEATTDTTEREVDQLVYKTIGLPIGKRLVLLTEQCY